MHVLKCGQCACCVFSCIISQDSFVSTFTRQHEKISKFRKVKKRQWHTKETMKTVLRWSAPLDCTVLFHVCRHLSRGPTAQDLHQRCCHLL